MDFIAFVRMRGQECWCIYMGGEELFTREQRKQIITLNCRALRENSFCAGLALIIHSLEGWHLLFPSGNHSAKGFSYYMIVSFCCQTTAKAHISVQFMNTTVTINLLKVNKFGESSLVSHPFSSLQGHETSVCWAHT